MFLYLLRKDDLTELHLLPLASLSGLKSSGPPESQDMLGDLLYGGRPRVTEVVEY
jgi:hypothetical protein